MAIAHVMSALRVSKFLIHRASGQSGPGQKRTYRGSGGERVKKKGESTIFSWRTAGQHMVCSCCQTRAGQPPGAAIDRAFLSLGQFLCADRVRVCLSTFAQGRRRVDVDFVVSHSCWITFPFRAERGSRSSLLACNLSMPFSAG